MGGELSNEVAGYTTRVVKPRRGSLLTCRVDLAFKLIGESPDMPPLRLAQYVPRSYTWTRNAPGLADTLSVTMAAEDLPFDLRIIQARGGLISGWLYEGRTPSRCKVGDVGFFGGVIDRIDRDRYGTTLTIEARDGTSFLLDYEMTAEQLNSIDLATSATLTSIIRQILSFVDGGDFWDIRALTRNADLTLDAASELTAPTVKPATKPKASTATPAAILESRHLHLSRLIVEKKTNAWDAITDICARFAVVPEVDVAPDGRFRITLINAADLNTSALLRPFNRGKRDWRLLVDGTDLSGFREQLELSATDRRPDFVVTTSVDAQTGDTLRGVYPPGMDQARGKKRGQGQQPTGTLQMADGVTSVDQLVNLSKAAFESLAMNQLELTLVVERPWSNGGGPHDPDMLDLAYGAALEVGFAQFDALELSSSEVVQRRLGINAESANRIATASALLGSTSLLFQATQVVHSWEGGNTPSYDASIDVRQFLGTIDMPVVGAAPRLPSALRSA